MEQESYLEKKKTGFILTVCYGIGVICGCMMIRLQMTEEAKASGQLLLGLLAQMKSPNGASQWLLFALRLFLPGAALMLCSFCFGLWMVGQPFLLLLFAGMGLQCGCYGILLLTEGYGAFTLLWYLPVAVLYFLVLLPVGCHGLSFGVQLMQGKPLREGLKRYIGLTVRQFVWLVIICAAAAAGYWGCRFFGIGLSA